MKVKFKPGTVLSVFSYALSLFVLGFYLVVLVHIGHLVDIVNERTPFIIELRDNVSEPRLDSLLHFLKTRDYVFDVKYIPKEKGMEIMREQFGDNMIADSTGNPLKDIIKLKLKNRFVEQGKVNEFIENLESMPVVENCIYEKESVEALKKNLAGINSVFLVLGIIFAIISFVLIYNNLRFILHADRFLIKNLELIGASPSFIKRPYLKLAIKIGLYSAVISIFLLSAILIFLNIKYDLFNIILDIKMTLFVLIIMFVISLFLPPVFINYLVNRYLRLTNKQMYS